MATTVESLRKAIGKRKNSRAFAWLADLMRQNGDLDLALEYVRAGLSSTPCEEGNLVLSRILADKRDWDGVVEACEFVLLRNPYCLSAIRRIGDAYAEKGDIEKRNSYYRRLHDLDPLDAFWKEEYAPKIEIPESGDVETPVEAPAETVEPAEVPAAERSENPEPLVEESRNIAEEKDDDPFSSLSTLLPADEENDNEVSFNDLEHSLDDAIAGFGEAKQDAFPAEEIDSDDISTALSGIFGSTDAEDSFAPAVKPEAEKDAPRPDAEDKPQSLSDAFDSIFGEDELPEEFVLSKPTAPSEEKPSSTAASDASSETSAELPPEKVSNDLPSEEESSSPFEKSSPRTKSASESTLEKSVESSFDSLFGADSDDLPLESLTAPKTILPAASDASSETPAELPPEKVSNDLSSEEESSSPFEKSSPRTNPASESTLEKSVESSFDSLFGADSDDALVEDPTTSTRTLAEIYFEQGVYDEAIKIYKDLLRKSPEDESLKKRLSEIENVNENGQKDN